MFLEAILLQTVPSGELWGSRFIPQELQHGIVRGIYSGEPGRVAMTKGSQLGSLPGATLAFYQPPQCPMQYAS